MTVEATWLSRFLYQYKCEVQLATEIKLVMIANYFILQFGGNVFQVFPHDFEIWRGDSIASYRNSEKYLTHQTLAGALCNWICFAPLPFKFS